MCTLYNVHKSKFLETFWTWKTERKWNEIDFLKSLTVPYSWFTLCVKLMSIRIYIRLLWISNYNLTPANCKRTLGDVVHLYGMVIELLRCLCVDYSMINRSYNSIRLIDVLSIIDISYKMHLSSFLTTKKLLCSLNVEVAFRESFMQTKIHTQFWIRWLVYASLLCLNTWTLCSKFNLEESSKLENWLKWWKRARCSLFFVF